MTKATFAAGCFWGVEELFRTTKGVRVTRVGYTGGHIPKPTYGDVCAGATGHAEAVEIEFDENVISYSELLAIFWDRHDPTTPDRQGPDVGSQYRSVVFYHSPEQATQAIAMRDELTRAKKFKSAIVTEILPAAEFFLAEEYHQKYLLKQGKTHC